MQGVSGQEAQEGLQGEREMNSADWIMVVLILVLVVTAVIVWWLDE